VALLVFLFPIAGLAESATGAAIEPCVVRGEPLVESA
jgi:hypothetical protein